MVINADSTTQTGFELLLEKIQNVVDAFGQIQTVWGFIVTIVLIVAFLFALLLFRRAVNKMTKSQIQFFTKVKKYEPSLYIELNQNMEYLRRFLFGNKWKKELFNNIISCSMAMRVENLRKLLVMIISIKSHILQKCRNI